MKKTFKMQDLDCANCAAKMEDAVRKIHGIQSVSISFIEKLAKTPPPQLSSRWGMNCVIPIIT